MKKLETFGTYSGLFILLDDEDYQKVKHLKFYLSGGRFITNEGKYLHQYLYGFDKTHKLKFKDGNIFDYRRENLKVHSYHKKIIVKGTIGKVTHKLTSLEDLKSFYNYAKKIISEY